MSSVIPSLQSDALVREIEQQLKDESGAIAEAARREAQAVLAQARASGRGQLHEAIKQLRQEGARRITRSEAQLETEARARAQQQAAQAVRDALPLLWEALSARWREPVSRQQWAAAVAKFCADRLPPSAWRVEHPHDWSAAEQLEFAALAGGRAKVMFQAAEMTAGLRIGVDQALVDATPQGLMADHTTVAALLLNEIGTAS